MTEFNPADFADEIDMSEVEAELSLPADKWIAKMLA